MALGFQPGLSIGLGEKYPEWFEVPGRVEHIRSQSIIWV
jgi:hypothetical protein